jgi:hypothetical protein
MLIVKIEIWPGGNEANAKEVARAAFGNVSDLADISDYCGLFTSDDGTEKPVFVKNHNRSDGCWVLLAKALKTSRRIPAQFAHSSDVIRRNMF